MYEYTKEERYLDAARLGLDWVEKVIRTAEFVKEKMKRDAKMCVSMREGGC